MMMRGMGRFGFCLRDGSVGEKVVGWMGGWDMEREDVESGYDAI